MSSKPQIKPKQLPNKQSASSKSNRKIFTHLLMIFACTFISYLPSFNNGFTNWDDQEYVTNNTEIRSFTKDSIAYQFTKYHMGNYHPITMLTYMVEYKIGELNPKIYHTTNFIIHILNAALVYFFIFLLCGKNNIAFIVSLLFAIHPMHVESVAWVAERKDVLYAFFYFLSLCFYLKYRTDKKTSLYIFTFLTFVLALLSKAVAVTVPIVMLLIDYYFDKKITTKNLISKIPFLVLSIVFGIIAVKAQESAKAIGELETYNLFERFLFLSYSLVMYIGKVIAPFGLSAFCDYPLKINGSYSSIFYAAPVLLLLIGGGLFVLVKKFHEAFYGILFFFITIFLVLQLLPVGGAIISERYTYIPYVGLFFIIASLYENNSGKYKQVLTIGGTACIIAFAYLTYERCKIWKDSISVWNDVIEHTTTSPKAYNNRGDAYNIAKQYELALKDLDRCIQLKYDYPDAYYNRGLCYYYLGKYPEAIRDYDSAIQYNPELAVAWFNRSGTYYALKNYPQALSDVLKAKELGKDIDPKYIEALQAGIK